MPAKKQALPVCALESLCDGDCREFTYRANGEMIGGFLVYSSGMAHTHRNACPDLGITLNWQPDPFLDTRARDIQCARQGASFRIGDGERVFGPCLGQDLEKVPVRVVGGVVWAETESPDAPGSPGG